MGVKDSTSMARYGASYALGTVKEVDPKTMVALVRVHDKDERVRVDYLRGKSAPPRAGEQWILDQPFDTGWLFVTPCNWSADLDWIKPPLATPWASQGAPYAPVGYRKEVEGFVSLTGRLTGGASGTPALVLPPTYRPKALWAPQGIPLSISAAGVLVPTATTVSLDNLRFYADS